MHVVYDVFIVGCCLFVLVFVSIGRCAPSLRDLYCVLCVSLVAFCSLCVVRCHASFVVVCHLLFVVVFHVLFLVS